MKRPLLVLAVIATAFSGSFAAPARAGGNELLGTLGGGALGGFIGSQFGSGTGRLAATGLGVFTGAVIGNSVGQSLDYARRPYYGGGFSGYGYSYTPYYAQPYYAEPAYVAPPAPPPPQMIYVQPEVYRYRTEPVVVDEGYLDSGNIPTRAPGSSRYCREYTQQIRIGDEVHESYGTACLQPDGSWRIER